MDPTCSSQVSHNSFKEEELVVNSSDEKMLHKRRDEKEATKIKNCFEQSFSFVASE